MERPDQLREVFRMQQALNERIGVRTEGLSDEEKSKRQDTGYTVKEERDSKHI